MELDSWRHRSIPMFNMGLIDKLCTNLPYYTVSNVKRKLSVALTGFWKYLLSFWRNAKKKRKKREVGFGLERGS